MTSLQEPFCAFWFTLSLGAYSLRVTNSHGASQQHWSRHFQVKMMKQLFHHAYSDLLNLLFIFNKYIWNYTCIVPLYYCTVLLCEKVISWIKTFNKTFFSWSFSRSLRGLSYQEINEISNFLPEKLKMSMTYNFTKAKIRKTENSMTHEQYAIISKFHGSNLTEQRQVPLIHIRACMKNKGGQVDLRIS